MKHSFSLANGGFQIYVVLHVFPQERYVVFCTRGF